MRPVFLALAYDRPWLTASRCVIRKNTVRRVGKMSGKGDQLGQLLNAQRVDREAEVAVRDGMAHHSAEIGGEIGRVPVRGEIGDAFLVETLVAGCRQGRSRR
jgi:hypothetical protein